MENETNRQAAPARPLTTRSLMASADPARRLQELLREQSMPDAPTQEAALPLPEPPAPVAPPPVIPPPAAPVPPGELVRLSVTLDGARLAPTEYHDRAAVPTRAELEQTHRAYVLRDQWTKSDAGTTWIVYMKRKTR